MVKSEYSPSITNGFCVASNKGCPTIPGFGYLGYFDVDNCKKCDIHGPLRNSSITSIAVV
jgi:hypothetical protein